MQFRRSTAALALAGAGLLGLVGLHATAATGLVARWSMDEGTGTTVADTAGAADGTLTGAATWLGSTAEIGAGALHFSGTTGRVTVSDSPALRPNDLTMTAWVRGDPMDPPTAGAVILQKGAFGCAGPSYGLYAGGSLIDIQYRSPVVGELHLTYNWTQAVPNLWDGEWHLIAAQIPYGPHPAHIGVDGSDYLTNTSIPSATDPFAYDGASDSSLAIGGPVNDGCGTVAFNGDIDDVRIYDTSAAFDAYVDQMPPVPTTLKLAQAPTFTAGWTSIFHGTITPRPRAGTYTARLYLQGSGTPVTTFTGNADASGNLIVAGLAPAPGTYDVVAEYGPAAPWLGSSDTGSVTVVGNPSATTLSLVPESPVVNEYLTLISHVTANPLASGMGYPTGTVDFIDTGSGTPVTLGSAMIPPYGESTGTVQMTVPAGLGIGPHHVVARFLGDDRYAVSESSPIDLTIGPAASVVFLSGPTTLQTHNKATFVASVGAVPGWVDEATVTFTDASKGTTMCVVPATVVSQISCTVPSLALGTHVIRATYSGNAVSSGSTSDDFVVEATVDTVQGAVSSLTLSTFYPYKDGYRDTTTARGSRSEPISVAITVRNGAGRSVRTGSVAKRNGAYAWAWNGRTASGVQLPAGRYTMTSVLKDPAGNTKTVRQSVVVSSKRLYWHSTDIYKSPSQAQKKASSWGAWLFSMPSGVAYKSLRLYVSGHSDITFYPSGFGPQDFRLCPLSRISTACVEIDGRFSLIDGWSSVALNATYDRSGRNVRAYVWAGVGGHVVVHRLRLHLWYAILK